MSYEIFPRLFFFFFSVSKHGIFQSLKYSKISFSRIHITFSFPFLFTGPEQGARAVKAFRSSLVLHSRGLSTLFRGRTRSSVFSKTSKTPVRRPLQESGSPPSDNNAPSIDYQVHSILSIDRLSTIPVRASTYQP